jgi:hypothetical protein
MPTRWERRSPSPQIRLRKALAQPKLLKLRSDASEGLIKRVQRLSRRRPVDLPHSALSSASTREPGSVMLRRAEAVPRFRFSQFLPPLQQAYPGKSDFYGPRYNLANRVAGQTDHPL